MIAIVDKNLECGDRFELISEAGVVQFISQLYRSDFQNQLLLNIRFAFDLLET